MKEEVYHRKSAKELHIVLIMLVLLAGVILLPLIWIQGMLKGDTGLPGRIALMILSFVVLGLIVKRLDEPANKQLRISVVLKQDSMVLNDKEIYFKDIESVKLRYPFGFSMFIFFPLPSRVVGSLFGKVIHLKYKRSTQYILIENPEKFMNSLAEHMDNAGVKTEKKTDFINKKQITDIINLDKKYMP
ncbi:MAG: hypothetical protein DRO62_00185 [Candidatus Altiarchaeales archaeon]|nr:MAG: hypothetical protein DRO62_00185 [Candidatus Altiarchaeales archaeon]